MFEGGDFNGGAWSVPAFGTGFQWLQFVLIVTILVLVIVMFNWDEDMKKFRSDYAFWKGKEEGAKEGLQYLGASLNAIPDHTGSERKDSLAEQYRKASEMESLIGSGREPNLYFTPVRQQAPPAADVATAPTATGVAAGFRDRMSARENEEELAQYLGR